MAAGRWQQRADPGAEAGGSGRARDGVPGPDRYRAGTAAADPRPAASLAPGLFLVALAGGAGVEPGPVVADRVLDGCDRAAARHSGDRFPLAGAAQLDRLWL